MENIKILVINQDSPYLSQVIKLGDDNSKTLGFFSEGAFMIKAEKKQIIIALIDKKFVGYLMYNVTKKHNKVTIIHLCIDPQFRGKKNYKKTV